MKPSRLTRIRFLTLFVLQAIVLALAACVPHQQVSQTGGEDFQTVEWAGLSSLTYPAGLAGSVEMENVEAAPPDPARMAADWHPAYARFRFVDYASSQVFQLPYPLAEVQVMIFRTVDFPSYTTGSANDYSLQQAALKDRLANGLSVTDCARPRVDQELALPFLPWVHAAQTFCERVEVLEFKGGKGIRYLTHYSQEISPVLDPDIFYTFQGLTDDGGYYISAVLPIRTGIFPLDPASAAQPGADLDGLLISQLGQLNSQPEDAFSPSLSTLDAMIKSLLIQ